MKFIFENNLYNNEWSKSPLLSGLHNTLIPDRVHLEKLAFVTVIVSNFYNTSDSDTYFVIKVTHLM